MVQRDANCPGFAFKTVVGPRRRFAVAAISEAIWLNLKVEDQGREVLHFKGAKNLKMKDAKLTLDDRVTKIPTKNARRLRTTQTTVEYLKETQGLSIRSRNNIGFVWLAY